MVRLDWPCARTTTLAPSGVLRAVHGRGRLLEAAPAEQHGVYTHRLQAKGELTIIRLFVSLQAVQVGSIPIYT